MEIRYGIARCLQQEKALKIIDDEVSIFSAKEAFSAAVTTELKKLGKEKVNHPPEIHKLTYKSFTTRSTLHSQRIFFTNVRLTLFSSWCEAAEKTYASIQSQRLPSRLIRKAESMCTKKLTSSIKITVLMILCTIRHVMVACMRNLKVHCVL